MKKRKDARRMIDQRESRTNKNDRTDKQVGLPEDIRVVYSEEDNQHDG